MKAPGDQHKYALWILYNCNFYNILYKHLVVAILSIFLKKDLL